MEPQRKAISSPGDQDDDNVDACDEFVTTMIVYDDTSSPDYHHDDHVDVCDDDDDDVCVSVALTMMFTSSFAL